MKSILPASHLLRQFVLFALIALLLLTVMRAAYSLWQFPKIAEVNAFVPLFVHGLRFDLALIGLICFVPVVLGSLLSITKFTRGLAKSIIVFFLVAGMFLILTLELLTPWFISIQGVRPDLRLLGLVEDPVTVIKAVFTQHTVPIIIGAAVSILILVAFWIRLELSRFLRRKVFAPTGVLLALVGGFVCLVAIWSTPDIRQAAITPADSMVSTDVTVNELTLNTTYKTVHAIISPFFMDGGIEELLP